MKRRVVKKVYRRVEALMEPFALQVVQKLIEGAKVIE